MKRLTVGLFALLVVGLLSTSSIAFAATEADPDVFDLIAGQYIDAGDVEIWNDADNLYIKIVGDGWKITETHVAVADDTSADIPQTKKGNPIPGKFEYKGEHSMVEDVMYTIPLDGLSGSIVIAVHAVVTGTGDYCGQEETAWAGGCGSFPFAGNNWATFIWYALT